MLCRIDSMIGRVTAAAVVVATLVVGGVAAAASPPPVEPVPPASVEVAVGLPPVPPASVEVAVGLPPASVEVGVAPVPSRSAPGATLRVEPTAVAGDIDPDLVARQVTALVVAASTLAALALRR